MIYEIDLTKLARKQIEEFRRAGDKVSLSKIDSLLNELREHPYTGTGKPEPLVGNYVGFWSRRINQKDRLVYKVIEDIITVSVVQLRGITPISKPSQKTFNQQKAPKAPSPKRRFRSFLLFRSNNTIVCSAKFL